MRTEEVPLILKTRTMQVGAATLLATAALAFGTEASAQERAQQAPVEEADEDGVRFRGGVSIGAGALLVSGFTAGMGGVDGRIGVQINDLIGVYAQPHLSFGAGDLGSTTGFTGAAGTSVLADFTFVDQVFVAAGGGFSYLGAVPDPGGELHFRVGGYPVVGEGENGIRRKGLMLGADMRVYFLGGTTILQPMGSIGYEAF